MSVYLETLMIFQTVNDLPDRVKSLLNEYQQDSVVKWSQHQVQPGRVETLMLRINALDDDDAIEHLIDEAIRPYNKTRLDREMSDRIEKGEWTVVSTVMRDDMPYAYTVGLSDRHQVEFILIGQLDRGLMGHIVNQAVEFFQAGKDIAAELSLSLKHNTLDTDIRVRTERYPMEWVLESHLPVVQDMFSGGITSEHKVILIRLGDKNNLLPGEDGYDDTFSPRRWIN